MKTLLVVLVVCVIAASCFSSDEEEAFQFCIKEAGGDEATIDSIQKGQPEFDNLELNCYTACFLKRIGILRPDGSFDEELAKKKGTSAKIEAAKVDALIQMCKNVGGKDDCEKAENIIDCFRYHDNLNNLGKSSDV